MTSICGISDTHGAHSSISFKGFADCSVLVHCGDFTRSRIHYEDEALEFIDWFEIQPFTHKVLIAGNHDWYPYYHPTKFKYMCDKRNIHYLQDSSVAIEGVNFYGSPWTPPFFDWAFMANEGRLDKLYKDTPLDTDVLITHGPQNGVLDVTKRENINVGSYALSRLIDKLKLKAHIVGHIHEQSGQQGITTNCSIMTAGYKPTNKPQRIIID